MGTESAVLMPNGSMDWQWFNKKRRMREGWFASGICVECGVRSNSDTKVVCVQCASRAPAAHSRTCAWCGTKRKLNGGMGSPTYPCWLTNCDDCSGKAIPETEPDSEELVMTVKPSDGISWRSCGKCKLRYGFEGVGMSHPHKDDGTFLWYIGWGDDIGYWPALPLPTGVHVQGEPQGGWGEVQLPGGVTISIPDADGLDGQPRHYTVKRGQAVFHLRLSGEKHWCIWKNKGRVEVAATRYCATPRVAIDALVASLNLSDNNGELKDLTSHASDVPALEIEELTDRVADAILLYRQHGLQRTKAALDGGAALVELRATLRHGDFGPHCLRLGLGDRTAQRWMQLAQSGLSAEEIQARGGIKKTLNSLSVSTTGEECPEYIKDAPPDGPELTPDGHAGSFDGLERLAASKCREMAPQARWMIPWTTIPPETLRPKPTPCRFYVDACIAETLRGGLPIYAAPVSTRRRGTAVPD